MGTINRLLKLLMKVKINFNVIALIVSLASLIIAFVSLSISRRIYILTSLDYIPVIDFQVTGDPPYCSWPEIMDCQLIIINKTSDIYKIDSVAFFGVEYDGFEDYVNKKIVEIPLVHIYHSDDFWYSKDSKEKIVFNFKGLYVDDNREFIYDKIKEKIETDYSYTGKENPRGSALPYLKNCCYYIDIEYEDKFENVKDVYYKYYHIEGLGYRKQRMTEEEYKDFTEKFYKTPFESNFNTIWEYLIKEYSQQFPP